jgi:hypothetical protein
VDDSILRTVYSVLAVQSDVGEKPIVEPVQASSFDSSFFLCRRLLRIERRRERQGEGIYR